MAIEEEYYFLPFSSSYWQDSDISSCIANYYHHKNSILIVDNSWYNNA